MKKFFSCIQSLNCCQKIFIILWFSCSPIATANESEVIRALEACLDEHGDEYVRLLGIDPKAKRRVFEGIIQRPVK